MKALASAVCPQMNLAQFKNSALLLCAYRGLSIINFELYPLYSGVKPGNRKYRRYRI